MTIAKKFKLTKVFNCGKLRCDMFTFEQKVPNCFNRTIRDSDTQNAFMNEV